MSPGTSYLFEICSNHKAIYTL